LYVKPAKEQPVHSDHQSVRSALCGLRHVYIRANDDHVVQYSGWLSYCDGQSATSTAAGWGVDKWRVVLQSTSIPSRGLSYTTHVIRVVWVIDRIIRIQKGRIVIPDEGGQLYVKRKDGVWSGATWRDTRFLLTLFAKKGMLIILAAVDPYQMHRKKWIILGCSVLQFL